MTWDDDRANEEAAAFAAEEREREWCDEEPVTQSCRECRQPVYLHRTRDGGWQGKCATCNLHYYVPPERRGL